MGICAGADDAPNKEGTSLGVLPYSALRISNRPWFYDSQKPRSNHHVRCIQHGGGIPAVLGHFVFLYIHPYMDGHGRLARFLTNLMLVSAGYVWTVIPVQQRDEYMKALEQASSFGNIGPFADLVADLAGAQAKAPPPV